MMRCLAAVLTASVALPAAQSNMAKPEKFTANAVNMNATSPRALVTQVDITINRWSTDEERDRLRNVLKEKGQDALLSALQKLPVVGYFNAPASLRWDIHFARERPVGDGRMVTLMTDRRMSSWEVWNQPRSVDYPFTLIQLQVDKDGHGVGKASVATRITEDRDGTITLEDFENQPVMLNDVRPQR